MIIIYINLTSHRWQAFNIQGVVVMQQSPPVFLALSPDALARLLDARQLEVEEFRCLNGYTKSQVKTMYLKRLRKQIRKKT